jgi:hypothetical protein
LDPAWIGESQLARAERFAVVLPLLDLFRHNASVFAGTLVNLSFVPSSLALGLKLVAAGTQFGDGLFCQELFQCPLLDVLLFVLLQLGDELNSALKD